MAYYAYKTVRPRLREANILLTFNHFQISMSEYESRMRRLLFLIACRLLVRGPDTYVYPAPLNLVEIVIAPLE